MKNNLKHKVKYALENYECGMCETGVIQIHSSINKKSEVTSTISGCLDCGAEYGIRQATDLKPYDRKDMVWA